MPSEHHRQLSSSVTIFTAPANSRVDDSRSRFNSNRRCELCNCLIYIRSKSSPLISLFHSLLCIHSDLLDVKAKTMLPTQKHPERNCVSNGPVHPSQTVSQVWWVKAFAQCLPGQTSYYPCCQKFERKISLT